MNSETRDVVFMDGVRKSYDLGASKVEALRGVDLTLRRGDMAVVVGPSGSGKTTLLNLVGCLDAPTDGTARVCGQDIARLSDGAMTTLRLEKIGFIFQSFNLVEGLSAQQNVEVPLLLQGNLSASERKTRAAEMLGQVGLEPFLHHRPAQLSGGQRQRVAIARALVTKPELVLADEPTANLDGETGREVLQLMQSLNETHDATFLFSTHDPRVLAYARRVLTMEDGRLTEQAKDADTDDAGADTEQE